jgi:16S rRNA (cytosine967-C5)-methyltransferase
MLVRAYAAQVILEVVDNGRSLSDALLPVLKKIEDERDQGLLQALCYGVCRWFFSLKAITDLLLDKPLKTNDSDIYYLIFIGLYQLIEMRIPDYAAVGETVSAAAYLKKPWAKNLVNGVLREYQRRAEELHEQIKKDYQAFYSHPNWMINKLKYSGIKDWRLILDTNNQHPPFSLRVNQKMISRDEYLKNFPDANLIPETLSGITLEKAMNVMELPSFDEGFVSVQDGAAQLAASLLKLTPGLRVLDACAAPGGKTAHMLELEPDLKEVIAIDRDEERLQTIHENLQRLKLTAHCVPADASDLAAWWDKTPFERILLDAPCSASGVIRRHPDIKLLRRESDISRLVEKQKLLLTNLWKTLKPGGILLYSTCSIFPEENVLLLEEFLKANPDAIEDKIEADWGIECKVGRQIYPGMHGMDGFYYGRLLKDQKCA